MKESKKLTNEQISALFCAVNEKNITGKDVIEEVEPLLREFYYGKLKLDGENLIVKFLNGQKFRLIAEEVKE